MSTLLVVVTVVHYDQDPISIHTKVRDRTITRPEKIHRLFTGRRIVWFRFP